MDLNRDGRLDMISGSWPGEIYCFLRKPDGTFAPGATLRNREGNEINVGPASAAHVSDWNGDGVPDLIIGTINGEAWILVNEGTAEAYAFGLPRKLEANGMVINATSDAAPVVVDWDGDGKFDLLVGTGAGSVLWYRNLGGVGDPRLTTPQTLIPESPLLPSNGESPPGRRAKICVTDWNGDGRLDVLLGDFGSPFTPTLSVEQETVVENARQQEARVRARWALTFKEYRSLQRQSDEPGDEAKPELEKQLATVRVQLDQHKRDVEKAQQLQQELQPREQYHGHVWLYLRRPAGLSNNGAVP